MSATKMPELFTFTNVESKTYVVLSSCVNYASPTRAEIDAGFDITSQVVQGGVSGFDESTNWIDSGNAGSKYTGKTAGRVSSGDSSIATYNSPDGPTMDCRSIFTGRKLRLTILIMEQGDRVHGDTATFKVMDSYSVEIGAISPSQDTEALQQITTGFGIKKTIVRNIPIPAAA